MPNKTLYVSELDMKTWNDADLLAKAAGTAISKVVIDLLKKWSHEVDSDGSMRWQLKALHGKVQQS